MHPGNQRTLEIALATAALLCAAAAHAEEIDYKKLYAKAGPAVVLIYGEQGQTGSVGTGSIIRDDGLVVSNAHVILDHETGKPFEKLFIFLKPEKITGQNADDLKRGFQAQWIAYAADLDLALLRIVAPPAGLPVLSMSDDSKVGVGEATAAIGHPEHGAKWSLTTGRIGGEWSDFEGVKGKDVFQMETSVNRGNSGGPLLDGNGYLIAINTSIARRSADGLAITGINFAIKSSVVRRWISQMNQLVASAPEGSAPPTPAMVAKAEPPQVEQEMKASAEAPPRPPAPTAVPPPPAPEEKRVTISASAPPAPLRPQRGYTTREPGKVLSPRELVAEHAREAFDDLERESQKRKGK
jgi:serine protease Do